MRWLHPAVPEGAAKGQVAIRRVCCQRFGPVGGLRFPRTVQIGRLAGRDECSLGAARVAVYGALPGMARMMAAFQAVACWSLGVGVRPSGVDGQGHRDLRDCC